MKNDGKDVGLIEDAMFYLQNAVGAENHAVSSYSKTQDKNWLELFKIIRRNRSKMLYKFIPEGMGEAYCFGKHISGMIMALKEIASRFQEDHDEESAIELIKEAKYLEELFIIISKGGGKKK